MGLMNENCARQLMLISLLGLSLESYEKEPPQSRIFNTDWHTIYPYPAFHVYRLGDGEVGKRITQLFRLAQNKTESI